MKKIFRYTASLMVAFMLLFSSCEKWIDTELNVDPDLPLEVPMNLLLPSIEANMAYSFGGNDAVRITGILIQYWDGMARQSQAQSHYTITNSDPNNLWNNAYATIMQDCVLLIEKAEELESPHNAGVGKTLLALSLGFMTDMFGDIPYSEAFMGMDNLSPAFDTQESIYTAINGLLDAAITDFNNSANAIPIGGDYFYGGDVDSWKKAAYALKARYAIHLTKRQGAAAYTAALAAVGNAISSNDEDLQFNFGNSDAEAGPLYQFMLERGDIAMCATVVDMMKATDDPRLAQHADDSEGDVVGSPAGTGTVGASLPGPFYFSKSSPVPLVTYVEMKFIEAEAKLATDPGGAAAAYNEAVKASLAKMGVSDADWEAANAAETGASIDLKKIMTQKYIALYAQFEAYNDWRRSDNIIGLEVASDATQSAIPRRLPYPTSTQTYNSNAPEGRDIMTPVWWDN